MKAKVFIDGISYRYHAEGVFYGNKIVVLKDSQINLNSKFTIKFPSSISSLRMDRTIVSSKGGLLVDVEFDTPTAVAKFVTGGSRDGYTTWKLQKGKYLKDYVAEAHSK